MKKHLLYTLLMLISLTGCSSPKGNAEAEDVEEGLPVINLSEGVEEVDKLNLSDAAERVEIVKLETTRQSLISDIEHIQVTKDDIWVYHLKDARVYRFDHNGKFLNKVGKIGNGPEEYIRMAFFWVDDHAREVYILTTLSGVKVYDYEGNFIRVQTKIIMDDMYFAEWYNTPMFYLNGLYFLNQSLALFRPIDNPVDSLWSIALVDGAFNKIKLFKNPAHKGHEEDIVANRAGIATEYWREDDNSVGFFNNELTIKFPDTDTIYYFDASDKELVPSYPILTNESKGDFELMHRSPRDRRAFDFFNIKGHYVTSNYIYLYATKSENVYTYRYDRNNQNVQLWKRNAKIMERRRAGVISYSYSDSAFKLTNDIDGGFFNPKYRSSSNYWIMPLQPGTEDYEKYVEELKKSPDAPQKQQLLDVIANTGEEDNPILLIAVLK